MSLPGFLRFSFPVCITFGSAFGCLIVILYLIINKVFHKPLYRFSAFMLFVKCFYIIFSFYIYVMYTFVIEPVIISNVDYYSPSGSLKTSIANIVAIAVMVYLMVCTHKSTQYESQKRIYDLQHHNSDDEPFPSNEARLYPLVFAFLIMVSAVFFVVWIFSDPIQSIRLCVSYFM